jgi:spore coat protein CotH
MNVRAQQQAMRTKAGTVKYIAVSVLLLLASCADDSSKTEASTDASTPTDSTVVPTKEAGVVEAGPTFGCKECGPTTDSFFSNDKVATLRLTFDEADTKPFGYKADEWLDLLWEKWNNHCGPYEWVPLTMQYESPDHDGDVTMEDVAIRLRGTKSRGRNPLAGFKLDFTKALEGSPTRRFAGLSRLNALSNEGDESNMVQCMGYKLMRDFGIEAPACNHLQVYINDELYGLMENVERGSDSRFLKHHFSDNDGALYAGSASCGFTDSLADLEYKGDKFDENYTLAYDIVKGAPADAEANLIPMLKCGDDTQTPDDSEFQSCISDWIDVDEWLKEIAAESLIPSLEDFFGARRNFYMYFLPDTTAPHGGRMKVWGWDYDTVLQLSTCYPGNCDPFTSVAGWFGPKGKRQNLVVRLTRVFKQQYCEQLNSFLDEVYDPEKVDEMASTIEPLMKTDPVVPYENWQAEVKRMRDYMVSHKQAMQAMVDMRCSEMAEMPDAGSETPDSGSPSTSSGMDASSPGTSMSSDAASPTTGSEARDAATQSTVDAASEAGTL